MQAGGDKIVKNLVKKVNAHPLGVDEINFFRDDNTILHFKNPEGTHPSTQPMPPSPTTPSSSVESLKPKQSKIFCPTLCSSWDPNNTNFCRNWYQICLRVHKKYPTLFKLQRVVLKIWTPLNDLA